MPSSHEPAYSPPHRLCARERTGNGCTAASGQRPFVVAAAMSAAAVVAWDHWLEHGGTGEPNRVIASALDLVTQGLGELDHIGPGRKAARETMK